MTNEPDEVENGLAGETFLLAERSVFGLTDQRLAASVDELTARDEIELMPGPQLEDRVDRTVLVSRLPLAQIAAMDGSYVLMVSPVSQETVTVRSKTWTKTETGAAFRIETSPGSLVNGLWSYSLDPRFRAVLITDDDPQQGVEGSIYHVADFGPGPVDPITEALDDGWVRSTFETPLWLIDQTPLAEACERVVQTLDKQLGQEDLRWDRLDVDTEALDRAATAVEGEWLPDGQQLNLTLDIAGQEIVRGKRLQPFLRYPVTLGEKDGGLVSATLGCSISVN